MFFWEVFFTPVHLFRANASFSITVAHSALVFEGNSCFTFAILALVIRPLSLLPFLLFLLAEIGLGQPTFEMANYGRDDGLLGENSIASMSQDRDRNLWIIGFSLITRYDGKRFQPIRGSGKKPGYFLRFYEKANGEKLVIDHLNQLYFVENDSLREHPLNDILMVLGGKRFCSDFYFDREDRLHIAFPNGNYAIIDTNGQVRYPLKEWGISAPGEYCLFNEDREPFHFALPRKSREEESPQFFTLLDAEGKVIGQQSIERKVGLNPSALTQLAENRFLYSSGKGHLIAFDTGGSFQLIPYQSSIIGLLTDSRGGVWVSTKTGVHYYKSGVVDEKFRQDVLPGDFATAGVEDFQRGIWIHARNKGLFRIERSYCSVYRAKSANSEHIAAMTVSESDLYFSTEDNEFFKINIESEQVEMLPAPPISQAEKYPFSLYFDEMHQRLWTSYRSSVYYFEHGLWKKHRLDKVIRKKAEENVSRYYFDEVSLTDTATFLGHTSYYFFHGRDTTIDYISDVFPERIRSVTKQGDSALVNTERGVYLQVGDSVLDLKQQFPILNGNARPSVYFGGHFLIPLPGKGVFVLKKAELLPLEFEGQSLRAHPELFVNEVGQLQLPGIRRWLEFRSDKLISQGKSPEVKVYADMPQLLVHTRSSNSNSIWFGSNSGIIIKINLEDLRACPPVPIHIKIRKLEVNQQEKIVSDSLPLLAYNQNFVKVSYLGTSFSTDKVQYRYRILGLQEEWQDTEETSLQLLGLPSGEYHIELEARIPSHPWGTTERLYFQIAKPYWYTWWFIALEVLSALLIIYFIVSYRIRIVNREKSLIIDRLQAEQKVLRAKMDPHFVFNVLASLRYLIGIGDNERAGLFLEKFSGLMRNTLDQTNMKLISLEDEVRFLRQYIEMEQMRTEEHFDFEIKLDDALSQQAKIPNFLIQPIVENAIVHGLKNKSDKGMLRLEFLEEGRFIRVVVEDDGIGYKRALEMTAKRRKNRESHGIKTVKARLELINGEQREASYVLHDLGELDRNRTGTRVELRIKRNA